MRRAVMCVLGVMSAAGAEAQSERPVLAAGPGTVAGAPQPRAERAGGVYPFRVDEIPSVDEIGATGNTVIFIDAGAGAVLSGLGWDVNLQAFGASWRSEIRVLISNSSGLGGFFLQPGTDDSPGGPTRYDSNGEVLLLADFGLPSVVALADGLIRMEFLESYDDAPGAIDGLWDSGFLFFPKISSVDCDGDADLDGDADFADIGDVLENWGLNYDGTNRPGDADRNGTVNFSDVLEVLENWGNDCP